MSFLLLNSLILRNYIITLDVLLCQNFFGESWEKVLEEGRAVNALEACKRFSCDANTLDAAWRDAESYSKVRTV